MDNDKLFFKIWNNKYLRIYILRFIKESNDGTDRVNLKSAILTIESRIEYNKVYSLEWCLKNYEYGLAIDKIKSGHYIHINKKSIRLLITNCQLFELYESLFKHRRNDLERLDLIEESVRLDSVFALKSFIQLYGGIDIIANTIINPKIKKQQQQQQVLNSNGDNGGDGGYGDFFTKLKHYALSFSSSYDGNYNNGDDSISEYTSLIDISLSYASSNVFDYLLLQPGLDWFSELKFIFNTISHKRNYFIQPIPSIKKESKLMGNSDGSDPKIIANTIYSQYSTLESIARVKFDYYVKQHDQLTIQESSRIQDHSPPDQQQLKQYHNIKRLKVISTIILDNLITMSTFTSNKYHHGISSPTLSATKKRDFIDKVFNKSIEALVSQLKQQHQQGNQKGNSNDFEPHKSAIISIIDLVLANLIQGESLDQFFLQTTISSIPFLKNYKEHSNYIMYLILCHYKFNSPIFDSSLSLLRESTTSGDINGRRHLIKIKQLLDKCISSPFPLFYIYYVDFHFYESNFQAILNLKSKLTLDAINHLWVLSILNFSISGFECYQKLIQTTTFQRIKGTELFSASSGDINSNWLIEFHVGKYVSTNSNDNTIYDQEQDECGDDHDEDDDDDLKITFIKRLLKHSNIKIPWAFLFEVLIDYCPIHKIEPFIQEFPIVKSKFIEWINSFTTGVKTFYPKIFTTNESTGEISIDKLNLFFKYNTQRLLSINLIVPQLIETISTVGKIKFINYLIRNKPESLIQILMNESGEIFSTNQVLGSLLFKLFGNNNDSTSTSPPSLSESIKIYKLLDHKEIEIIQKDYYPPIENSFYNFDQNPFDSHTLEDCLFGKFLIDSIFGGEVIDGNCITILSLLNHDVQVVVPNEQLSTMKLITVQDKIEFIKFIYSNKLVSSFSCSFSLLLIEKLIKEIEIQYKGIIFINYEKELIQLVLIMNSLSNFSDETIFKLLRITFGKRMNRLFNQLIILSNTICLSGIKIKNPTFYKYENEDEEMIDSFQVDLQYNQIIQEINWENSNKLLSTNDFKSKFLLFINGNYQSLINSFKSNDLSFFQNTNANYKKAYILEILKLSIQYFDFINWIELFNSVVIQNHYKQIQYFELTLFKLVYKFNRLDILAYLLEPQFTEPNRSILEIPFIKGYYPIAEFLIKNKQHLLLSIPLSTGGIIGYSDAGLDRIFNLSILNGHCSISNLLVESFKGYNFTFSISNILQSGYSNILKFIIKSNLSIKELHFYTIGEYYKTGDIKFLKKLIQQVEKHNHLSKTQKLPNYQNRILLFKDTLKKNLI